MSFRSTLIGITSFVLLASLCSSFAAADEPRVVKLAITPAVAPVPSLKYQLLPPLLDRRPGNAAVRYERIALYFRPDAKIDDQANDWLALPLDEFRNPTTLKAIDAAGLFKVFPELQLASRLQSCEWELPFREQMFFKILVPELQEMRRLARYVALKARREIVDRRYDDATVTLQVGYALARHVAAGPTLINGLVGAAIAGMMDKVLLDFAQAADAPSLYWALSFQPRPFIDPRPGFEAEMSALFLSVPELTYVDERKSNGVDAQAALSRLVDAMTGLLGEFQGAEGNVPQLAEVGKLAAKVGIVAYAALRKGEMQDYLIDCKWPKPRVKELSDAELLLAFTRLKYEELRDIQFRSLNLPYWQARTELAAADERLRAAAENREEVLPFGSLILPALNKVGHNYAKSERRLDTLRIVEALRLYAGKHDGKLPATLDAVTEVPLPPLDVITGKPFVYSCTENVARLTQPDELHGDNREIVYEITIAPAGKVAGHKEK